jgi:transcription elongation GreA/GreB family factor
MGKRAGEVVEVKTPGGTTRYRILEVGYGES